MRTFTGKEAISIVPLDKSNWEDAVKLQVQPEQVNFVSSNAYSIAESKYYPALLPCGIFAGKTMVGFTMYGRDDEDHQFWIYRFMIDQRYQRQGFELEVPVPSGRLDAAAIERVGEAFHQLHARHYGYAMRDEDLVLVNAQVSAVAGLPKPTFQAQPLRSDGRDGARDRRSRPWHPAPPDGRDTSP